MNSFIRVMKHYFFFKIYNFKLTNQGCDVNERSKGTSYCKVLESIGTRSLNNEPLLD